MSKIKKEIPSKQSILLLYLVLFFIFSVKYNSDFEGQKINVKMRFSFKLKNITWDKVENYLKNELAHHW